MPTGSTKAAASLASRFFRQVAAVSVVLLLLAGAVEGWFGWRETRAQVALQQGLQAQAAAAEIEQFLRQIRQGLEQVQRLPWGQADFGLRERREELHRLLALQPSLVEVADIDGEGREQLAVSRLVADRIASGLVSPVAGSTPAGFGPSQVDASAVPHVWLVLPRAIRLAQRPELLPMGNEAPAAALTGNAGMTLALVNLRFLGDVVSGLRVADGGEVYVVDGTNRLIAHADPTQVLRQRELGVAGGVVARAAEARKAGATGLQAADGPGLNGGPAIRGLLVFSAISDGTQS